MVAVVSEGIKTADGHYVCEKSAGSETTDAFGHIQMTGTASYLAGGKSSSGSSVEKLLWDELTESYD